MKDTQTDRRSILKASLFGLLAVPAGLAAFAQSGMAAVTGKLVELKDPVASALKYTHDATKAPERKAARQGVEAKDQTCANCALYTKQGDLDGQEVGKCTMIQTGLVTAKGWCNSWAKKA